MENQPKLNSSKEVIAFLAERFPHCFSAEGEARPLKIGIFQDLVDRVAGEMNLSKNATAIRFTSLYFKLALPVWRKTRRNTCRSRR